jgi:hypothetical protein
MGLDMYLEKSNGEEVCYWRKANQIRGWLVENKIIQEDDDCVERVLSREHIKLLVEDCKRVLEDHSLAENLLPTTSGFFFGNAEYDDAYFEDLKHTVEKLEPLIESGEDYIYHDWW